MTPDAGSAPGLAEVLDRGEGAAGGDLVLRRRDGHFEIISNGVFLMDTRDGASERAMVRAALDALPPGRSAARVLIGGLGVGFSARAALDHPRAGEVHVVELEPKVIEWHSGPLGAVAGDLPAEPRCTLVRGDVADRLDTTARGAAAGGGRYDSVCLDTDNGPDWVVRRENGRLYGPAALDAIGAAVVPGGTAAFWSAMPAPAFAALLERRFGPVTAIEVPARAGGPDIVYLVRVGG